MRLAFSTARNKFACLAAAGAALLLLPAFQFNATVYDEVKPSVVRVACPADNRAATGFLWSNPGTAVTALHLVTGCANITVFYEVPGVQRTATIAKVLRHADLALLKIDNPPNARVLVAETRAPALTEHLSTLGFPLQIRTMTSTSLQLRYGGKTLRDIVPDSVAQSLSGGSPSLDLEIDSIEGHLLPGHSGAPVFNEQRKVIAVADGGLENGAAAVSWAIPAKFLTQLSSSTENTAAPRGGRNASLFSSETEAQNRGETACSGQVLTKLRSTMFQQASNSADDPKGVYQLVQFFGVDPSSFEFDVYQHLDSGATFVVPAGARLVKTAGGDCAASFSSGKVEMRLQLAIMASPLLAQEKSLAFEKMLAGKDQLGWAPDATWTYLMPVPRFDGMVVRRRAWYHVRMIPAMFQDKYAFEALAVRNAVFIGSAAMYSATPEIAQQINLCRYSPNLPACAGIRTFVSDWVRAVLAIQLTTFPVG
jgi:S1-C subfamily serine protease